MVKRDPRDPLEQSAIWGLWLAEQRGLVRERTIIRHGQEWQTAEPRNVRRNRPVTPVDHDAERDVPRLLVEAVVYTKRGMDVTSAGTGNDVVDVARQCYATAQWCLAAETDGETAGRLAAVRDPDEGAAFPVAAVAEPESAAGAERSPVSASATPVAGT